tara:strand:+ start:269 stop:520 length:252 start_codon:yes stop_codon:yes gene_type:complete
LSITQEKFRTILLLAFLNLSPTLVKLLLRCFQYGKSFFIPNIAEKYIFIGSKGDVFSFKRAPNIFLNRELIPGAEKYRYKVID